MINRTPELVAELRENTIEITDKIAAGMRSVRFQWNVEGTSDPLTLYGNANGTFIVEPGGKQMPADEWLQR